MRPIRLTLQAFGPFAAKQVIDFEHNSSTGLFGIYGPTGAGKTSIFDGLCFALFGQSAGAQREGKDFRSDHAQADLLTQIELIFDLGEKRYVLRRIPVQERIAKRGKKPTQQLHQAWLFDATGINTKDISDDNSGKPIAEKKTSLVEQAIQDLLGYSAEQFRQIILLPQGQFRKVLDANTKERSAILQNLFDVSLYERLQDTLKTKAAIEYEQINDARIKRDDRLEQSGFESFEALEAGIKEASDIVTKKNDEVEKLKQAHNIARTKFDIAKSINDQFIELAKAKQKQDELNKNQKSIDDLIVQLEAAKLAEKLIGLETNVSAAKRDLKETHSRVAQSAKRVEETTIAHKKALSTLDSAKKNIEKIDGLNTKKTTLESLQETLNNSKTLESEVRLKADKLKSSQTKSTALKAQISSVKDKIKSCQLQAKSAIESSKEFVQLEKELAKIDTDLELLTKYASAVEKQSALTEKNKIAEEKHGLAKSELRDSENKLHAAEKALSNVQAIHLANHLKAGEECPVCGSEAHPNPATGDASSKGLNQVFETSREAFFQAQKLEREQGNTLISFKEQLKLAKSNLDQIEKPDKDISAITTQKETIENKINNFKSLPTLESIEDQQTKLEVEESNLIVQLEELSQNLLVNQSAYDSAKALYDDAINKLPPQYQRSGAIKTELDAISQDIEHLKLSHENALNNEREASTSLTNAKTSQIEINDVSIKAEKRFRAELATFEASLQKTGFDADSFNTAKSYLSKKDELEEQIDAHKSAHLIVKTQIEQAIKATANTEQQDLTDLSKEMTMAEESLYASTGELNNSNHQLRELNTALKSVETASEEISKLNQAYAPLGEMAELTNGTNPFKLKLVDFAIAAMYDDVLAAANLRLGPMTDGRFELQREAGVQGGRAYRGLDTLIFDAHTETLRPTSSLSGGEGFLASLALALGLSDVVQAQSGGVRLDALFIDEGFGSLDPDSLDLALETLQTLADNNRMVGIISHVEEVKRTIPNGFSIVPSPSGSHIHIRNSMS